MSQGHESQESSVTALPKKRPECDSISSEKLTEALINHLPVRLYANEPYAVIQLRNQEWDVFQCFLSVE